MKRPTYEDISPKQMINRVTAARMPFRWSLNPYRGCTHGCSFCYARATHTFMGLTPDDSFRNHVFIKADGPDVLERQLARLLKKHRGDHAELARSIEHLAIGTATDPYQPIEARSLTTRRCLEILQYYHVPVSITTRSPLILRDIRLLQQMSIVSINISINTLNKSTWRNLEPSTPSPIKRLETVQELASAGLPVGVFAAPIIPFLTDSREELEELIASSVHHGAKFLMPSILRLAPDVKAWFLKTMDAHYPHLTSRYHRLYKTAYAPSTYSARLMQTVTELMNTYGIESFSPRIPCSGDTDSIYPSEKVDGNPSDMYSTREHRSFGDEPKGVQFVLPI